MLVPTNFPIIDPHIHQWDLLNTPRILSVPKKLLGWNKVLYEAALRVGASKADKDYVGAVDHVAYDYLPDNYQNDIGSLNVTHAVHVEAEWQDKSPFGPVDETRWLDTLFKDSSATKLGAMVGYVDLRQKDVEAILLAHREASKKFVGVRQMLAWDKSKAVMRFCKQEKLSQDKQWKAGFELLEKYNLSFDAWFFHHQLGEMVSLANSYPNVQFILDHMGTPIGLGGKFAGYGSSVKERQYIFEKWQSGIAAVAECPNVMVKISGFFMPVVGWGYHQRKVPPSIPEIVDDFRPMAEFVLSQFGVDRCMFASNFPMDKISLSYASLYDVYWSLFEGKSEADKAKLFHDNAKRCYKIAC